MTRTLRLSAALLLAGLALVSLRGTVWAENTDWDIDKSFGPGPSLSVARVTSLQDNGGFIGFGCVKGEPSANFVAMASTASEDQYPEGVISVAWKIDNGSEQIAHWEAFSRSGLGGVALIGQAAYDLALEIMHAKNSIILRSPNGTIKNDLDGAANAILQILLFCDLYDLNK